MAEVDSRTQEDELLANAKLVDPDEALVPATKLGIAQPFGAMEAVLESSTQDGLWDHGKARRRRGRDSGCVDEAHL
jgi:hypothetical protein